jgi:hypothetical protein
MYAAMTKDEGNAADGRFSAARRLTFLLSTGLNCRSIILLWVFDSYIYLFT